MPMFSPYQHGQARIDPLTGQLLSSKDKTVAGLLQILPGACFIGGIGRLYSGHTTIGVLQLMSCLIGLLIAGLIVTIPLTLAAWAWVIADGIFILSGKAQDGNGLYMR
jgi:TM2 domain-containing membrane protein YozV